MLTTEVYRDSLLLSHLARSIAQDACAVHESCNTDWPHLKKYGDQATQNLLDNTYSNLTWTIGRQDLSTTILSALSPMDAARAAWAVTGTIKTQDDTHVVATPEGHDPLVEKYLAAQGAGRGGRWGFWVGTAFATAVGIGIGVLAARKI